MKRIIFILAVLVMLASIAMAQSVDLSGMTTEELRDLQSQINAEIVSRGDWKEVKVPAGDWEIGKDIPAGEYEIEHGGRSRLSTTFRIIDKKGYYDTLLVPSKGKLGKVILEDGYKIQIEDEVIFKPVTPLAF